MFALHLCQEKCLFHIMFRYPESPSSRRLCNWSVLKLSQGVLCVSWAVTVILWLLASMKDISCYDNESHKKETWNLPSLQQQTNDQEIKCESKEIRKTAMEILVHI